MPAYVSARDLQTMKEPRSDLDFNRTVNARVAFIPINQSEWERQAAACAKPSY